MQALRRVFSPRKPPPVDGMVFLAALRRASSHPLLFLCPPLTKDPKVDTDRAAYWVLDLSREEPELRLTEEGWEPRGKGARKKDKEGRNCRMQASALEAYSSYRMELVRSGPDEAVWSGNFCNRAGSEFGLRLRPHPTSPRHFLADLTLLDPDFLIGMRCFSFVGCF